MNTKQSAAPVAQISSLIGMTPEVVAELLKKIASPQWEATRTVDDLAQLLFDAGARPLFTPPAIDEYWPGQGGVYAGQVREDDGTTYHEILAEVKPSVRLDHAAATKWAASLSIDGHSDFMLPTRRGASLLYANLSHLFEKAWHWTSTIYSSSYAWYCYFNHGNQYDNVKSYAGCARAVRRFIA